MTKYETVVAIIMGASFFAGAVIAIIPLFFPKTEDDATDPYVREYPGLSAPREDA